MTTITTLLAIYGALHLLDRVRRIRAPGRLRRSGAATVPSAAARERLGLMARRGAP